MATLVHDDVLDEAPLRRGHPTAWATHGRAVAVATGDYLFARAFAELAALGDPVAIRIRLAHGLRARPGRGAAGRAGARSRTSRPRPCSSAAGSRPVACSRRRARSADVSAGSTRTACAALDRFGELLGLAFQLADDVLDCAGDPKRTGKALGTDLRDGTTSLPLLLAAQSDAVLASALREPVAAADVLPLLCARRRHRRARSGPRYCRRGTRDAPRPSSSGHPARDTAALRALLQRAIDRDS